LGKPTFLLCHHRAWGPVVEMSPCLLICREISRGRLFPHDHPEILDTLIALTRIIDLTEGQDKFRAAQYSAVAWRLSRRSSGSGNSSMSLKKDWMGASGSGGPRPLRFNAGPSRQYDGASSHEGGDGTPERRNDETEPRHRATMNTEAIKRVAYSPPAERMRLYRKRRREGMQLVRIPLRVTEIDDLIRIGRLTEDQRHDAETLQAAVSGLFHVALDEMRDYWLHARGRSP
jgi:hypothetical protein